MRKGDVRWVSGLDEPGLLAMGSAGIVGVCMNVFVCHTANEGERKRRRYIYIP